MADGKLTELDVIEALKAWVPGLDDSSREYMAGMVIEEAVADGGIESVTASALEDLIGPFLLESGDVKEEDVHQLCKKLLHALGPPGGHEEDFDDEDDMDAGGILNPSDEFGVEGGSPKTVSSGGGQSGGGGAATAVAVKMGETLEGAVASGYEDPYLGLSSVSVNYNSHVPIKEAIKRHKEIQREREKQLRLMREWEKEKLPLPVPERRHGDKQLAKITNVIVESFSVSVAGRELLKDAPLKLVIGRKYGLIGRNGVGKSTFIGALVRREIKGVHPDISVGCVEQEITGNMKSAIEAVLEVDVERLSLIAEEKKLTEGKKDSDLTTEEGKALAKIYARLEEIEAVSAPAKAATILGGLGFSPEMQERATVRLSGGWRMRVALARALFADPDILCLDEPTNHLDLHAVAWLSEYLSNWNKTCIIVSHARHFLNDVCTDIIDFREHTLKYFRGDYDLFERNKAEMLKLQQRQFEAQQMKRDHIQSFIDRFRYNAKRAALVQSRIKALEKLPMLDAVASDPSLSFQFTEPEALSPPFLQLQDVYFSYDGRKENYILKDVNFNVDSDSRIAVCGVNGSGKSTLLKLLTGAVEATEGMCTRHNRLRIGFFSQHHVDGLDLTLNAVNQLIARFPSANLQPEDARTHLGKFGISGTLALEPLYILSGGQKSRVAIAVMAFDNPQILILDEPTNHLDLDAVQALITALNEFKGGVVVVSHDAHMLSCVADEIWHVEPSTATCVKYGNDFDVYKKNLLKKKAVLPPAPPPAGQQK